ncbi:MAG: efflux RND transporter periplasmic adaptor subunit [Hydrogenophaga sp.]|uniref:efflux RND transporter periplasmic adaptor subunit n=1 Tax=Hydrogenophaga sp. TaxID=1904254 RepID=UPI001BBDBA93|nr:efflux RND transporter periplasmic adaptor subunit [Hydrogenophaga sp.]MBS3910596.1 efflux RND transporter periplasmic adaptor subunit [Hydrogenophaga sp.]MDO9149184.1 efflux RND transporter periplasmic adaptor subunit [Hydrogenophaga sp.]MDO9606154.1 efflux RND transporter periplasmic adaptor subunit [Hydrogenophaga sp.]MDP2163888.1 efflux RND transporter periplasmic adaptor subunit [Hydrogenophaga sp.]MDP3476074.1 efflux RND transporter periplasmic adaptor subunit [Hydrogenophaga sp.]
MNTPRRPWIQWLLLALLVLAIALGLARALNKRAAQRDAANQAAEALQQAPVYELTAQDVVAVQPLTLAQTVGISGSLRALQTAVIKARVAGEVQGLQKREGDTVRAGEVVARIDSTEARARLRQASQQAEAALAQVSIARRALDNNQALVRQGFISATALDTATANLAAAEANHQAALAARDLARKALADTTLRSPLNGQVSARLVQNGERVGLDARILEVVDLSGFELEAALAPADAVAVLPGLQVSLTVEGLAQPVPATVARINPSVQAGSRSVLVYLRVSVGAGMRQGLFAQGHIITGQVNALAVPLSAVRNDQPQPYVQVLQDGRIQHHPVTPGVRGLLNGEPMVALDNLPAGTQLLRAQAGLIREGTAVRLKAATETSSAPSASSPAALTTTR